LPERKDGEEKKEGRRSVRELRRNVPKLQVGSGPGRGIAHFLWRAGKVSAMRCPKPWSRSRRLLYTTESWEAKMEIPAQNANGRRLEPGGPVTSFLRRCRTGKVKA
jgi:hypothetical protein